MSRKGRDFELLVKMLEETLAPLGVEIKSPDLLTDKITGKNREVDVSIRSRIGSAECLIIIECRDRATNEDVTWLEQLATKKQNVGANIAIAVSSKGFSHDARQMAEHYGIEIRLVEEVTVGEVASWIGLAGISFIEQKWVIVYVGLHFEKENSEEERKAQRIEGLTARDKVFRVKNTDKQCSIEQIFANLLHDKVPGNPQIDADIPEYGTHIQKNFIIRPYSSDDIYQFKVGKEWKDIEHIDLTVEF